MKKKFVVAAAATVAVLSAASVAYALTCRRATQRAQLEVVSVTVDGVPQTDLTSFSRWNVTLSGDSNGGGVELYARTAPNASLAHAEVFDVASTRDQ